MNRILRIVLALVGLGSGCSKDPSLTPGEFTKEYAEALRASANLKVDIVRDLQLKVTTREGRESTSFLDNAYKEYQLEPGAKQSVIQRFVSAGGDAALLRHDRVQRDRLVPVVKDKPWLEETRTVLLSRGSKEAAETVYEDFTTDLIIVYAEDLPNSVRYLTEKDLKRRPSTGRSLGRSRATISGDCCRRLSGTAQRVST